MNIYNYHGSSGEYLSATIARESPMEPGVFLVPANATGIAPPATAANEVAVFEAGAWAIKPNYRGRTFYLTATAAPVVIDRIGVAPDAVMTDIAPIDPEAVWVTDHWELPLDVIKARKITELSEVCRLACESGHTSSALGTPHFYPTDCPDGQLNLVGNHLDAKENEADPAWTQDITCTPDGRATSMRVAHTAAQTLAVSAAVKVMMAGHRDKYNFKKQYVLGIVDGPAAADAVAAVTWESVE